MENAKRFPAAPNQMKRKTPVPSPCTHRPRGKVFRRTSALLCAVMALGLSIAVAQERESPRERTQDIDGWAKTRWGMGIDELSTIYPEFTIGSDYFGHTAGRLPDVDVGADRFQVYLMFEGVGGLRKADHSVPEPPREQWRLVRVELRSDEGEAACYRVKEALLAKYGPPTKRERELDLWALPTTTIRALVMFGKCGVIYHPTVSGENL